MWRPANPKITQKPSKITRKNGLKLPFHGGNRGSNPLRDANLQSKHSFKNKPSAVKGRGLFLRLDTVLDTVFLHCLTLCVITDS